MIEMKVRDKDFIQFSRMYTQTVKVPSGPAPHVENEDIAVSQLNQKT